MSLSVTTQITKLLALISQHSDGKLSCFNTDEETEHKIADEIDEVLGKTPERDTDADIVLTEYLSDGEDAR